MACPHLLWPALLEIQLTANTEYTVRSCKCILIGDSLIDGLVVVAVDRLEIGGRECDIVLYLIAATQTDAVAVNHERDIVHVFVAQSIACELATARDIQLVGDIPFDTGKELVGIVFQ